MAKEYIEREATLSAITFNPIEKPTEPDIIDLTLAMAQKYIRKVPAADVVEVRHGEWVKDTKTADVCAEYRCSLCGFMYCEADPKYPPYKYCPECGSKNEYTRKYYLRCMRF